MAGESQETPGTRPDPTVLTTEQLMREMSSVEREFTLRQQTRQRELADLKELTETRLRGASDVTQERFDSVETQFELIERQRVEQKKDTKDAVDAALSAAKEAVKEQTTASERSIAKSEAATSKQLEQQNATFTTAVGGVSTKNDDLKDTLNTAIADLKERIGKAEQAVIGLAASKQGANDSRDDSRAGNSLMLAVAGTFLLAMSLGIAIAALFLGK